MLDNCSQYLRKKRRQLKDFTSYKQRACSCRSADKNGSSKRVKSAKYSCFNAKKGSRDIRGSSRQNKSQYSRKKSAAGLGDSVRVEVTHSGFEKYIHFLDKFKKKKSKHPKVARKLGGVNLSQEDIRAFLVQNKSRYSSFEKGFKSELKIYKPSARRKVKKTPRSKARKNIPISGLTFDTVKRKARSPSKKTSKRVNKTHELNQSVRSKKKRKKTPISKQLATRDIDKLAKKIIKEKERLNIQSNSGSMMRVENSNIRFDTKLRDKKKPRKQVLNKMEKVKEGKWSQGETEKLFSLHKKYRNNYGLIAKEIPGRTKQQVKDKIRNLRIALKREAERREERKARENGEIDPMHHSTSSLEDPTMMKDDSIYDYVQRISSKDQYKDLIDRISSGDFDENGGKSMFS
ncbi:unnamed protein product [Moneuplotes crassus]|uniref:Uncharacterized protein n=1 Tax=Euplotes crassus TaxID=5936 RepID=A0AAD1X9S8_EUPCR|nr:unnamed protein product [Moneuplotes crassus]